MSPGFGPIAELFEPAPFLQGFGRVASDFCRFIRPYALGRHNPGKYSLKINLPSHLPLHCGDEFLLDFCCPNLLHTHFLLLCGSAVHRESRSTSRLCEASGHAFSFLLFRACILHRSACSRSCPGAGRRDRRTVKDSTGAILPGARVELRKRTFCRIGRPRAVHHRKYRSGNLHRYRQTMSDLPLRSPPSR